MDLAKLKKNKSGFTLLEIIIVIVIVGVLASLALPRLFSTIEFSRSAEALANLASVRKSLERCYIMRSQTYVGCNSFASLDINDPATAAGNHFTYGFSGFTATGYTITATRNTLNGGDGTSTISITQTATAVTRAGTGDFSTLQ